MRTLQNLNVPKDTSPRFPFGNIQNETDVQEGTPVVREIYGDILVNIYKLLEVTKTIPTGDEDSNLSQYQIIDALRKFTNTLNDVEQVLSLSGAVWSVPLDLSILPNKYVFISRASDNYDSNVNYSFKGTGVNVIAASSPTGFSTNDEVLTVIDTAGVRMYSLTKLSQVETQTIFNVLAAPISFNDSANIYYLESSKIYSETPAVFNIEENIRNVAADGNLEVSDALVFKNRLLALVFNPDNESYSVYSFNIADLSAPATLLNVTGFVPPNGQNLQPYMFCDGAFIYFTNLFNSNADDNRLSKFNFDTATNELAFVSNHLLQGNYAKTTNTVIQNNKVYTFIGSTLNSYDLDSGVEQNVLIDFTLFHGVIFQYNGAVYYTKDEVAALWTI